MTKPPDRIFAWPSGCYQGVSLAGGHPDRMVEYIRADLVTQCTPDPAVLALVEAAREVYRISERDHVAWRKLSEALAAFDKTHQHP